MLRPGGLFLFHSPNAYGYPTILARLTPGRLKGWIIRILDGREESDVFPTFYKANTRSSLESVSNETGLKIVKIRFVVSDAVFSVVPPLALLELLLIRLLMTDACKQLRNDLLVTLQKADDAETSL